MDGININNLKRHYLDCVKASKFFFLLCFFPFVFFSSLFSSSLEEEALKRIHSLLLLKDLSLVLEECEMAKKALPDSLAIRKLYVRALAENGQEFLSIKEWKEIEGFISDPKEQEAFLEALAWGVLNKGENSSQLIVKNFSLVGAFLTQDAKAVKVILAGLRSSNAQMRALSIRLASSYGDACLKEEIVSMLQTEQHQEVFLEAIKAVGILRIHEASEFLKAVLYSKKASWEEQYFAIQSLALLYEKVEEEEIRHLVCSKRAGFRILAAEIVWRLELHEYLPFLIELLDDPIADVKMSILNVLGLLAEKKFFNADLKKKIEGLCHDANSSVALTASWVAVLIDLKVGLEILEQGMQDKDPTVRRLASAITAFAGRKGSSLSKKMIKQTKDPYVAANLAVGLLNLRDAEKIAAKALFIFLDKNESYISWEREGNPIFQVLSPTKARHIPNIPHLPAFVDGMTRLSLLNQLAMIEQKKAIEIARSYLQHSLWGLSATASVLLLEEGETQSLEIIQKLLEEKDEKIRLQAALALAFIGGDEEAASVLTDSYAKGDREMKLQILEALGRIGSKRSISFLLDVLEEPFQSLRIAAASALIQTIYH